MADLVGPKTLAAYRDGTMPPERRRQFESFLADGTLVLPEGESLDVSPVSSQREEPQEEMGIADRARAAVEQVKAKVAPTAEAARQGIARGLTLGLDDVAAGVGAYLGDLVARQEEADAKMLSGGGESFMESARAAVPAFQAGQEERRAVVEEARKGDETAFEAAQLLGLLMVPGGGGVKGAAAQGAVASAGLSDADTLGEAGEAGALGGALGAGIATVAPRVIQGAGDLAGRAVAGVKGMAGKALERAGSQADELRVLTTMGAHGGAQQAPAILREAANVPGGVPALARTLRETGISRGITTTEGVARRAAEVEANAGRQIGRMVDDATDAGGFVDVRTITDRLRAQAAAAMSGGKAVSVVQRREADAFNRLADRYDEIFPGGVAPVREMKDASIALGQDAQAAYRARTAGRDVEGQGRALVETRRASEAGVDDALAGLGADPGAYQAAKTQFQAGRLAREAAETSLGRASKNNLLGLTDVGMLATTGPMGALARKFAAPLAASARATAAETAQALAQRLQQSPALRVRLGPWSQKIADAASDPTKLARVAAAAFADKDVERAVKADIAAETLKALPPEQRREQAAGAMAALGGAGGFSPKTFADNFKSARGDGAVYGVAAKELGGPADEMLTALYAASKRAQGDAPILGAVIGVAGGDLKAALAADKKAQRAMAAALRDPALQRLAAERKPSAKTVRALASSPALRQLLKAAKMSTAPADMEAWVWGAVGGTQKGNK